MTIYSEGIYGQGGHAGFDLLRSNDFIVTVYDYDSNTLLNNVEWELYRRDPNRPIDEMISDSHIFVDSGTVYDGVIRIYLSDYGLRGTSTEFYLRTWSLSDNKYVNHLRIKYYPSEYLVNETNVPYFREAIQVKKESIEVVTGSGGGGGMGPGVYHVEYKDRPLPTVHVLHVHDDDSDKRNKNIKIINISNE